MGLADGCPRAGFASLGRNMPEPRPEGDYLRKFGHLPGG
jgi:hypothetical protein